MTSRWWRHRSNYLLHTKYSFDWLVPTKFWKMLAPRNWLPSFWPSLLAGSLVIQCFVRVWKSCGASEREPASMGVVWASLAFAHERSIVIGWFWQLINQSAHQHGASQKRNKHSVQCGKVIRETTLKLLAVRKQEQDSSDFITIRKRCACCLCAGLSSWAFHWCWDDIAMPVLAA